MTLAYLGLNAVLYAIFGVLCIANSEGTARNLGYVSLNPAGRSEYAVVYGAMQLGLAVFFAYSALGDGMRARQGVVLAAAIYVPIAIVRWFTVWRYRVRAKLSVSVGALETFLACAAIGLLIAVPVARG